MGLEKFAGENLMIRQVEALERIASALDYLVDSRHPSSYAGTIPPLPIIDMPVIPNQVQTTGFMTPVFALPDATSSVSTPSDPPAVQSGLDGDVR